MDTQLNLLEEELYLLDEPLGPYRFCVWQPEPDEFGPPPTQLLDLSQMYNQFDVIFQFYRYAGAQEFEPPFMRRRFLSDRTPFLSPVQITRATFILQLKLAAVSEPGIQQIFHHVHSHVQAMANDPRNSNLNIIPLSLYLEFLGDPNLYNYEYQFRQILGDRFYREFHGNANDDDYDNQSARVIQESMNDSSYNLVPATKSSIEALEKVRLGDASFASMEVCMICMEHLSSTVELTRMPCSHLYHGDCIVQWLNTSHLCPLCRFPMPSSVVSAGVPGK